MRAEAALWSKEPSPGASDFVLRALHSASAILVSINKSSTSNIWVFVAFFLVQKLQHFKGSFTPFGIKFGFGSLAIFKAPTDAKSPDDLSSSLGKRSEK